MEINIDEIVKNIDVQKLIEEKITDDVLENMEDYDLIEGSMDNNELRSFVTKRVTKIIGEYLDTTEGKTCVIDIFKERITSEDIILDDEIIKIISKFLRKNLKLDAEDDEE